MATIFIIISSTGEDRLALRDPLGEWPVPPPAWWINSTGNLDICPWGPDLARWAAANTIILSHRPATGSITLTMRLWTLQTTVWAQMASVQEAISSHSQILALAQIIIFKDSYLGCITWTLSSLNSSEHHSNSSSLLRIPALWFSQI